MLAQSLKRMSPVMARVSGTYIWNIESTQVCHLLLERRSNQSTTMLFVIIYFIVIIYFLLTTLAIWLIGIKKFSFEIKGSLLIKRDKTSLNRNISSAIFYLFYKVLKISGLLHGNLFDLVSLLHFKRHYQHLIINL